MDRELIDYLPQVLKGVRELKAIVDVQQPEMGDLWEALETSLADQFVEEASENGLGRFESILKITPKETDNEDERRFRILTRFNEQLPYSYRVLENQLKMLCGENGYTVKLYHEAYTVVVRLKLFAQSKYSDVGDMLKRIMPANMVIDLNLLYNTHKVLNQYTNKQLSSFSHTGIRREDFIEVTKYNSYKKLEEKIYDDYSKYTHDQLRMVIL